MLGKLTPGATITISLDRWSINENAGNGALATLTYAFANWQAPPKNREMLLDQVLREQNIVMAFCQLHLQRGVIERCSNTFGVIKRSAVNQLKNQEGEKFAETLALLAQSVSGLHNSILGMTTLATSTYKTDASFGSKAKRMAIEPAKLFLQGLYAKLAPDYVEEVFSARVLEFLASTSNTNTNSIATANATATNATLTNNTSATNNTNDVAFSPFHKGGLVTTATTTANSCGAGGNGCVWPSSSIFPSSGTTLSTQQQVPSTPSQNATKYLPQGDKKEQKSTTSSISPLLLAATTATTATGGAIQTTTPLAIAASTMGIATTGSQDNKNTTEEVANNNNAGGTDSTLNDSSESHIPSFH